ncbi:zinc-dependent peptidase [Aestuariibaculum sediminum]|uniref:Zinc-dependent peptidase n=1 Tax=Aestuariibaculum sediminum TaxID=2770637 RepID=A0A8J6U7T6_9FLAO|nr:zinc-dependent peptidase [Aestuariibaculum sediminum]MBD0832470.1 zinc-dependent peptidase [Aestuariibaculum sediminum]
MFFVFINKEADLGSTILIGILLVFLIGIILNYVFKMVEMVYVMRFRKPLYNHFYLHLKRLDKSQKRILDSKFSFYQKLNDKSKRHFEHRVRCFINDKEFIGRAGIIINDEIRVLISATAVMLTFGFRDFYIGLISKIVVYPTKFYSKTNDAYHKGEFNPKLEALVVSWEDFQEGFKSDTDNLNLGIHELTHAIHINSIKERDVSSTIFSDTFKELAEMLVHDEDLRNRLMTSDYFRKYAFTNQFEFLAVIIENFIETPKEFSQHFPEVYSKVKQMLNFRIANY